MIIACQSCNKKFDIDQNLIPSKGRLVQCSSCNHKWFFINKILVNTIKTSTSENLKIFENKSLQERNLINGNDGTNIQNKTTQITGVITNKVETNAIKIKKKNNFLNLTIVFIITFVAFIILVDTFKYPLGKIVPNLDFLLSNLYESIKDIILFIRDLI
tara:strand:- start:117 stop:593 length:477 start_codon:yes stop_codon:yes gene_type:complete